jgi:hypothetical protein
MYARRLQHAQTEPTNEALLPPILASVPISDVKYSLVGDTYRAAPSFKTYQPASVDRLTNYLASLGTAPLDIEYDGERSLTTRQFSPHIDRVGDAVSANGRRN